MTRLRFAYEKARHPFPKKSKGCLWLVQVRTSKTVVKANRQKHVKTPLPDWYSRTGSNGAAKISMQGCNGDGCAD
jgi:hypothetical protein